MPGSGCQICDVSLNSQEQLQQHRTGRKHLNKVKETGVACDQKVSFVSNSQSCIKRSPLGPKSGLLRQVTS
jgi:hypothetical protein